MVASHPLARECCSAPLIFLVGPTAIGKTELALHLAEEFGCEIIGVDSMQVYRYMDIGTAKPSLAERGRVPHHLIDYVLPDEEFSALRFVADCREAIREIRARDRLPLLVGGTGLYFSALEHGLFSLPEIEPQVRQGLQQELVNGGRETLRQELEVSDPESASRIHLNDTYRLLRALEIVRATGRPWSALIAEHQRAREEAVRPTVVKIGLARSREELYARIEQRVEAMVEAGLLVEVETLLARGYHGDLRPMQSLGYRHMLNYLEGEWSWERALELLARDTRRYAKRQLTWFNPDPEIRWCHPGEHTLIRAAIASSLTRAQG